MERRSLISAPLLLAGLHSAAAAAAAANTQLTANGDFDFAVGKWRVHHRQLKARLAGSTEWREFDGTADFRSILGGLGCMDDNVLEHPDGAYRAVTLRAFDPKKKTWSIWWLDGRFPDRLDVPVVGTFEGDTGTFFADDTFEGKPIKVRFIWIRSSPQPRWEQAFSPDGGKTWETNWVMSFTRAA
jgi:hypothetical protein